ncbi:MAG: RNA-binding protein [Minwuiales bacterium]|nr:RNA-binding protein [Minwuiales bacterium]
MTDRLRKCVATGEVKDPAAMVRFVVDPDGWMVPDLAGKLPGRGVWLSATRDACDRALKKRLFERAARRRVNVAPDLADRLAEQLQRRCLDLLGLARGAGLATVGFEKVKAALGAGKVFALVQAADAAADGRDKLRRLAGDVVLIDAFSADQLSLALGRENVVHAALAPGRLTDRFIAECNRLGGVCPPARRQFETPSE